MLMANWSIMQIGKRGVMLRCRDWEKEQEKAREKERDLLKERIRQIKRDNETDDGDEDVEPWKRKPYYIRCL